MEQHVRLAQQLHPRLLNFFKKFPPPSIAVSGTSRSRNAHAPEKTETITIAENTSSLDPNLGASSQEVTLSSFGTEVAPSGTISRSFRNPFLPWKNPRTGNWQGPSISLRRQAELFKLAAAYNVLPLMPTSPKHPEVKEQKRIEHGLRVQGTGVGKKVKGHKWERTLRGRLDERRRAMEGMPEMIREWKERGHGRGWKKWPK